MQFYPGFGKGGLIPLLSVVFMFASEVGTLDLPLSYSLAVRKSLIPPQPPEVASTRVENTMRSTSGSPRPAG